MNNQANASGTCSTWHNSKNKKRSGENDWRAEFAFGVSAKFSSQSVHWEGKTAKVSWTFLFFFSLSDMLFEVFLNFRPEHFSYFVGGLLGLDFWEETTMHTIIIISSKMFDFLKLLLKQLSVVGTKKTFSANNLCVLRHIFFLCFGYLSFRQSKEKTVFTDHNKWKKILWGKRYFGFAFIKSGHFADTPR